MREFIEILKSRRSIRLFKDEAVPKNLIEEILDAGRYAPSAMNGQPWKFAIITDRAFINRLSIAAKKSMRKIYSMSPILKLFIKELRDEKAMAALKKTAASDEDTIFYRAPLLIVIAGPKRGRWVGMDCSMCAENMMLASHSLGLGSCCVGRMDFLPKTKSLLAEMSLPADYKIYASLAIGYPKEPVRAIPERKKDNILCWK